MKLSIFSVKFERTEYIRCELESMLAQGWNQEEYEVLITETSVTSNNTELYESYKNRMNIKLFFAPETKKDWYMLENGRTSHSAHYNRMIENATGDVLVYLSGEFFFYPNAFNMFYSIHKNPNVWFMGNIPNIDRSILSTAEPSIIGWIFHPLHTPGFKEFLAGSIRTGNMKRIGGFDERYMQGWQCEGNEMYDRLMRSDMEYIYKDTMLVGHIDHDRQDKEWKEMSSSTYRMSWKNRRLMDSGYYDDPKRSLRYYRPGTEKSPVVNTETKTLPEQV